MNDLPFFKPIISGNGGNYEGVADFQINTNGDLIASFNNGTMKNLGKVVGEDGAVYVPHIDEHNVLSFVLEGKPEKAPDPVDLDPSDAIETELEEIKQSIVWTDLSEE